MSQAHVSKAALRPALRLRDCYWFFVPLVLMVELNMISKSVIHAFLARTDTPSVTLAAFNSAFTFYFAITSATEVMLVLCLSYLKSRADVVRLMTFTTLLLVVPLALAVGVGFTRLGNTVFGGWFGLGAPAQAEARAVVGLLITSIPILILRGTAFSLLMMNRSTIIITWSTLVRVLSLTASLAFLPAWLDGAAVGAAALVICMAAETVFGWMFAWRLLLALPARRETQDTFLGYWRFSWPLIVNSSAEMGVIFVINLFLGRLANAELAIAAFGVVHGLVSLLMAPMRNLTQSAQTMVARREDVRIMLVFTGQLVAFFTVLALALFQTPLRDKILRGVMGLTPELATYAEPAMGLSFLLAGFWSCTALFRGLLAKARTTSSLAASGVLRVMSAGVAGAISLAHPDINGAVLGIAAWIVSYAIETVVSSWRLSKLGWYVEGKG
ncbi:MAG: hypothetical protein SFW09_21875 [Hyphomicrobiaceae bacterium]|nr:hypothetical protein [Hyphomicrobiaceae bacterium]